MSKSDSKARILQVYKILVQESDSEHYITIQQIIDRLEELGIKSFRKTVISDIDELIGFGIDIECVKSTQNRYYMKSNIFTLSELKLLVDAVEASQFITQAKSAELIDKLSSLTSSHSAESLCRHIFLSKRLKSENEEIYDVVDKIHAAINQNRQISFLYYEYDGEKNRMFRNNGERYTFSPYGMTWEDGRYYVIGFSVKHSKIITFRADRISGVEVLNDVSVPKPKNFNIADFSGKLFRMYGGETAVVTLKCKNEVMKSVIDRFGTDVQTFPASKGYFNAVVEVGAGQTFFGWVFQFGGDIKIVKPAKIKRQFQEMGAKIFG